MANTKTYDPGKVTVNLAGSQLLGFAPGTFITAERTEDTFTAVVGSAGETGRTRIRNKSGTITLTLMGTSLVNDVLSALVILDELTGAGQGPLLIKSLDGTTLIAAESAWVKKPAVVEYSDEMPVYEWVIETASMETFAGGFDTV